MTTAHGHGGGTAVGPQGPQGWVVFLALFAITAVGICLLGGLILILTQLDDIEMGVAPAGQVWSPEHGHWH